MNVACYAKKSKGNKQQNKSNIINDQSITFGKYNLCVYEP